jgi:hypothetical protein
MGAIMAVSALLGFVSGSVVGAVPGMVAYRSDASRIVLWMRFDQFFAIMAMSCGLASLGFFRVLARNPRPAMRFSVVLMGGIPWVPISMLTAEGDWFRVGGALLGLLAATTIAGGLALLRRLDRSSAHGIKVS